MTTAADIRDGGGLGPESLGERVRPVGVELIGAMGVLLGAIPGSPHRPTDLSRRLGLSRVILSRVLGAIDCGDPIEALERFPGPDSLRSLVVAAGEGGGAPSSVLVRADAAIDRFAELIREDFGTRGALTAAISAQRPELQQRLVLSGRYQVYQGMRQILGVEADTWLTSMMFVPSADDDEMLEVTSIHGALGMRRLRPDVGVHFTFGAPGHAEDPGNLSSGPVDLREFYEHDPAGIESFVSGGQLVHRLADDRLGRHATVDMLAVSHNARGSRRYATAERPKGGVVVFPDVPVKTMICDALVHEDVFPGAEPELMVFNPGPRGPANPVDPAREIDRVEVPECVESLGLSADRFMLAEAPRYREIVERVCAHFGRDVGRLCVHRLRMSYPVHGFQFVMAFEAPARGG